MPVENVMADTDLVNVAVPRRHYSLIIRTLAEAMASDASDANAPTGVAAPPHEHEHVLTQRWTTEDVRRLRRLLTNPTARALMDLTCAEPGRRVSLGEVQTKAGRTFHQSRADLAVLTKLVRQRFGHDQWPVNVSQTADGTLAYDASPEIASAWNSGE